MSTLETTPRVAVLPQRRRIRKYGLVGLKEFSDEFSGCIAAGGDRVTTKYWPGYGMSSRMPTSPTTYPKCGGDDFHRIFRSCERGKLMQVWDEII